MFYDGSVHKLQINMVNELGDTALHMASKWGYGECVQQREVGGGGGGGKKDNNRHFVFNSSNQACTKCMKCT